VLDRESEGISFAAEIEVAVAPGVELGSTAQRPVRVWEAATGKELARLEGHDAGVLKAAWSLDAAWSPDRTRIVEVSRDDERRAQRTRYFLPDAPPFWCIERHLWPYHSDAWQTWLAAYKAGRDVPMPTGERR
jgi:hypothetical protein